MALPSRQAPLFCADCFRGTLRGDVEPQGTEEIVYGLPTYVTHPEPGREPLGVVVVMPDMFGWKLHNTRALADAYARRIPAVVLLPELMNGYALPESVLAVSDKLLAEKSWWYKYLVLAPIAAFTMIRHLIPLVVATRAGVVVSRISNYLRSLRLSPPSTFTRGLMPSTTAAEAARMDLRIGVAGFCWGGKYVVQLMQATSGPFQDTLADCGFTAHPSFLSLPGDLENVSLPLSVANGDDDVMMPRVRMAQAKELLGTKRGCEVVEYPGAKHGFAVRGDPNDQRQADLGMQAEDQAVRWFRRWFARNGEA
ncbi:Protein AIM2-like protein 3 [Colletotrichum chlorophyti]|uniref:Protein AIM2-like protein 3 n=1 Tax=Colletotrichum chlorophyti TaxID=708187 RepID=A0A1Q8RNM6_9PEZI|nr:Protein AIM2-like protein 3 [Colletotrichum chlorophyti]